MDGSEQSSRSELEWIVGEEEAGTRLDVHVAGRVGISRNQARHRIESSNVLVDGSPARASRRVQVGDAIACTPPALPADRPLPESGHLDVLHEDSDLVVVNKPAGIVVHPGAGRESGTLAGLLLHRYPEIADVGSPLRPGIVHRLDLGTTGVLLVARSDRAYRNLSTAFAERRIDKSYLGIVYGSPHEKAGTIDRPILRHPQERKKMTVGSRGRTAVSHYRVLAARDGVSLLLITIETGRTHQIRVHLKSEGLPLVGDPLYGEARWKALSPRVRPLLSGFGRPALHAFSVGLDHPITAEPVFLCAPVPRDLRALWHELFRGDLDSEMTEAVNSIEKRG